MEKGEDPISHVPTKVSNINRIENCMCVCYKMNSILYLESVISLKVWDFVMTHYLLKGGFLSSPVTPHFNNGSKLPRSTQWCVLNRINSVEINTQGFSTFSSLICAQVIFTWKQLVKVQEFICENIKIRVFYCCIDDDDDVRMYVR